MMFTLRNGASPPITIDLQIDGKDVCMELDTGAAVSIIGEKEAQEMFPNTKLRRSEMVLKTYTSDRIKVVGEIDVDVLYQNQSHALVLVVVSGDGPTLFGRNWLEAINLNWNQIAHTRVEQDKNLNTLLTKYADVFTNKLGTMTQHRAKLYIKEGTTPKFYKARPVPFALQQQIEEELNRLESLGIIEPVCYSEWASPVVPVPKQDYV